MCGVSDRESLVKSMGRYRRQAVAFEKTRADRRASIVLAGQEIRL
jgi:hypothetical protein